MKDIGNRCYIDCFYPPLFPQKSEEFMIFSSGLCLCILNYRPCLLAGDQKVEEKGAKFLFLYYPHNFPVSFGSFLSFKDPLGVF